MSSELARLVARVGEGVSSELAGLVARVGEAESPKLAGLVAGLGGVRAAADPPFCVTESR